MRKPLLNQLLETIRKTMRFKLADRYKRNFVNDICIKTMNNLAQRTSNWRYNKCKVNDVFLL